MLKKVFLLNLFFISLCFSHQEENALLNILTLDENHLFYENIFIFMSSFIFLISLVIYRLRIKKYDKLNNN